MSGALQAVFQNQRSFVPPLPDIGAAFGGGYFAGQISTAGNGVADYNLVIAPLSSGQSLKTWRNTEATTAGADSNINGAQNTADMVADGSSTVYPAAHFCNDLVLGGFSDWYMPAKNELEICYYNLKPTTTSNNTSSGINSNSVPARASNYTTSIPAQTSSTAFQSGGSEAFTAAVNADPYWSSTEVSTNNALRQYFSSGLQSGFYKSQSYRVRAVRKVAI
jgi:hypothetical protein